MNAAPPAAADLSIVAGDYAFLRRLRSDPEVAEGARLRWIDRYVPTNRAFKPMVRDLAFDICELALATYVQARAKGVPITILPITLLCRFQHGLLIHDACERPLAPKDLEGRRVGVRAYSQTTGVWIRSLLRTQFGVDTRRIEWVVSEVAHVAGFQDPPNVTVGTTGAPLTELLRTGEIDALVGEAPKDPCLRPLLPEPSRQARAWFETHQYVPVNHVMVVRESLLATRADDVRTAYRALRASLAEWKSQAPVKADFPEIDLYPLGISSLAPILAAMSEEAAFQSLIPRRLSPDHLMHPFSRDLE